MALPILAKTITSALVKKGSDAKKESKKVSTEKLLPGSVGNKVKVSKFKSRTPRTYRKNFKPTKFLPPSKIDENFDMAKLDDLLASLVDNTEDLKKVTKKDVEDEKKKATQKKNVKEKLKRSKREEKTEEKKAVTKVKSSPMKFKAPDFFKDIFAMGGRLILATGVMQVLNYLTDPKKSDGLIKFLTDHMDKIILGSLAILGATFVASFLPVVGMMGTIFSLMTPIVTGLVAIMLNPAVLAVLGLIGGGMALREILYRLEGPAREFYEEQVRPTINKAQYGDRADEGQFIRDMRDNYGRISTKEERDKLTDKEKTTAKFLEMYEEKLKELSTLKRQLRSAKRPNRKKKINDQIRSTEQALTGISSQIRIGGKSLSELREEYEADGSLPQTSIQGVEPEIVSPVDESPRVTPDTVDPEPETGEGSIEVTGDGSGGSGTLTFKKDGKVVGSQYKAYSGVRRTWGSSQEDRRNVSGDNYPMPDGTYPLIGFKEHGPWPGLPGIGDWSTFINPGGTIGSRSGIMLHNDIGSDGTAGCIGVELGGTAGTPAEKNFLGLYKKVNPKNIKVSLASGGGSSPSVNRPETTDTKISSINRRASYEQSAVEVAMVQVPVPVPVPTGGVTGGGGFTGSSGGNVNRYEDLVVTTHYREA